MRGNVYRFGAGIALGLVVILASVSSAYAKSSAAHTRATQARTPVVVVVAVSHYRTMKSPPVARAAGHKIA